MEKVLWLLKSHAEPWLSFCSVYLDTVPSCIFLIVVGLLLLYLCHLRLPTKDRGGATRRRKGGTFRGWRPHRREAEERRKREKERRKLSYILKSSLGHHHGSTPFRHMLCPDLSCEVCNRTTAEIQQLLLQGSLQDAASLECFSPSSDSMIESSVSLSSNLSAIALGDPVLSLVPESSPPPCSAVSSNEATSFEDLISPSKLGDFLPPEPTLHPDFSFPEGYFPLQPLGIPSSPPPHSSGTVTQGDSLSGPSTHVPKNKDTHSPNLAALEIWHQAHTKDLSTPNLAQGDAKQSILALHSPKESTGVDSAANILGTGNLLFISPDALALLERQVKKRGDSLIHSKQKNKTGSFPKQARPDFLLQSSGKMLQSIPDKNDSAIPLPFWSRKDKPQELHMHRQPPYPKTFEDHLQEKRIQLSWDHPALQHNFLCPAGLVSDGCSSTFIIFSSVYDTSTAQGSSALPAPQAQESTALPTIQAQESTALPTIQAQESTALPTIQAQESTALPAPQAQESTALPAPQAQESTALPVPQAQESSALPVPQAQESTALPTIQAQEPPALPAPQAQESTALPTIQAQESTALPTIQAQESTALPTIQAQESTALPTIQAQESTALPTIQAQESTALPTIQAQESTALPTIQAQESTALPTIQAQESTALPTIQAQESTALPVPQAQEPPALPVPQAQESSALPVPQAQESSALPVPQALEPPALPAPQAQKFLVFPAPQAQRYLVFPAPQAQESPAFPKPQPLLEPEIQTQLLSQAVPQPQSQLLREDQPQSFLPILLPLPPPQKNTCGVHFLGLQNEAESLTPSEIQYLEHHLLKKKHENLWGIPSVVLMSQGAFCPPAPNLALASQRFKAHVPISILPGDFRLSSEVQEKLEHHLQNRIMQNQCGLPRRVCESLSRVNIRSDISRTPKSKSHRGPSGAYLFKDHSIRYAKDLRLSQPGSFSKKTLEMLPLGNDVRKSQGHFRDSGSRSHLMSDSERCSGEGLWYDSEEDPAGHLMCLSGDNSRASGISRNQKKLTNALEAHFNKKVVEIHESHIPRTVYNSLYSTRQPWPLPEKSCSQVDSKDLAPVASVDSNINTSCELSFLGSSQQKMLEDHIQNYLERIMWGLPEKVLETIEFFKMKEEPSQSVCPPNLPSSTSFIPMANSQVGVSRPVRGSSMFLHGDKVRRKTSVPSRDHHFRVTSPVCKPYRRGSLALHGDKVRTRISFPCLERQPPASSPVCRPSGGGARVFHGDNVRARISFPCLEQQSPASSPVCKPCGGSPIALHGDNVRARISFPCLEQQSPASSPVCRPCGGSPIALHEDKVRTRISVPSLDQHFPSTSPVPQGTLRQTPCDSPHGRIDNIQRFKDCRQPCVDNITDKARQKQAALGNRCSPVVFTREDRAGSKPSCKQWNSRKRIKRLQGKKMNLEHFPMRKKSRGILISRELCVLPSPCSYILASNKSEISPMTGVTSGKVGATLPTEHSPPISESLDPKLSLLCDLESREHRQACSHPTDPSVASEDLKSKPVLTHARGICTWHTAPSQVLHVHVDDAAIHREQMQEPCVPVCALWKDQDKNLTPGSKTVSLPEPQTEELGGGDAGPGSSQPRRRIHGAPDGTLKANLGSKSSPTLSVEGQPPTESHFRKQIKHFLQWIWPSRKREEPESFLGKGSTLSSVQRMGLAKNLAAFTWNSEPQQVKTASGNVPGEKLGLDPRTGKTNHQEPLSTQVKFGKTQHQAKLQTRVVPVQGHQSNQRTTSCKGTSIKSCSQEAAFAGQSYPARNAHRKHRESQKSVPVKDQPWYQRPPLAVSQRKPVPRPSPT
nr:spermatogenesis-associated protein 31D1 [Oryctolagus cuniculus]